MPKYWKVSGNTEEKILQIIATIGLESVKDITVPPSPKIEALAIGKSQGEFL